MCLAKGGPFYFEYGDQAIEHLTARDPVLGEVIDRVGQVRREVIPDLFEALVHSITGQQISTKAHLTVWKRIREGLGEITPATVYALAPEELQRFGISLRKAGYLRQAAEKVLSGELDLDSLTGKSDGEVCRELSALNGVGVWTAEMLMTFSMQRPDIVSFGDLAILRGMRMVYHHREVTRKRFETYRRRYSPYGTVASLYLWAVAGGAVEGMRDYAPKKASPTKREVSA